MENLYHVLGVERTATPEQIKTAYLAMVRATHYAQGNSTTEYKDIKEAGYVLGDRKRRIIYNYNFFGIDNEDGSYGDPLALSRWDKNGYSNLTREQVQDKFRKYSTNMDIRYNREQREDETATEYSERRSWEYMGPKYAAYQFSGVPYFKVKNWRSSDKASLLITIVLLVVSTISIVGFFAGSAYSLQQDMIVALTGGLIVAVIIDALIAARYFVIHALRWSKRRKLKTRNLS